MEALSKTRICRIRSQGYGKAYTDEEVAKYAVGNRFAYQMCALLFLTGLILKNIPVLSVAATIALMTVFLPYHPFDYLYNYGVRHLFKYPKVPKRSAQAKFACGIAAIWVNIIIYLFYKEHFIWGYSLGGILLISAFLVSTLDLCIPSLIYNRLFGRKTLE